MQKKKSFYLMLILCCFFGIVPTMVVEGAIISSDRKSYTVSTLSSSSIEVDNENAEIEDVVIPDPDLAQEKEASRILKTHKSSYEPIDEAFARDFILDINLKKCIIYSLNEVIQEENETKSIKEPLIPIREDATDEEVRSIVITKQQADKLKILDAAQRGISNLAGIEYFQNIEYLYLGNNPLGYDFTSMSGNSLESLGRLKNLKKLDLIDCSLEDVSGLSALGDYQNLVELNLASNFVEDLSPLSNIISLKHLDLYYNCVSDISPLAGLVNLEYLNLGMNYNYYSYCSISDISALEQLVDLKDLNCEEAWDLEDIEVLGHLSKLERLNLNYCMLQDVSNLNSLTSLRELHIDDNSISELNLSDLPQLEMISIEGNPLDSINIRDASTLKYLNVEFTEVRSIKLENVGLESFQLQSSFLVDVELIHLEKLKELRLVGLMKLTDFTFLTQLPALESLDIWNISIDEEMIGILSQIPAPEQLRRLNLANNGLRDVSFISRFVGLDWLTILDNPIGDVTEIGNITSLTQLYIHNTRVSDMTPLINLNKLEILNLKNSRVTTLPEEMSFPQLKGLSLAQNQIKNIEPLSKLSELEYLDLSYNDIEDITVLSSLKQLESIDLRHNQIQDVSSLNDLEKLDFKGNYDWYWIQENPLRIPEEENDRGRELEEKDNLAGVDGENSGEHVVIPPTDTPVVVPPTNTPVVVPPTNTPVVVPPTNTPVVVPPANTPVVVPPTDTSVIASPVVNVSNTVTKRKEKTETSKNKTSGLNSNHKLSVEIQKQILYINLGTKKRTTFLKSVLLQGYSVKYFNCSPKNIVLNKKTGKVYALKIGTGKIKVNFYWNGKYLKNKIITVSIKKFQKEKKR